MDCELCCIELIIKSELKSGLRQRDIAKTYALALRSSWQTDWARVNRMIIARWSRSGLERIKKMAHSGACFNEERGK